MVEITTERLLLRPFQVDDLGAFVAYRSDPESRAVSVVGADVFDGRRRAFPRITARYERKENIVMAERVRTRLEELRLSEPAAGTA